MAKKKRFVDVIRDLHYKDGLSWDEVEKNQKHALEKHGTNKQFLADEREMEGKTLKKLESRRELYRVFADIFKDNPGLMKKPMKVRDMVWGMGIHCWREDINVFQQQLRKKGTSLDRFLATARTPAPIADPDSPGDLVSLGDLRTLKQLSDRYGKDNVLRALELV